MVQGVLATDLTQAADIVLPGASPAEKEAAYTNESGRVQGTGQSLVPPGDAREDWTILRDLAAALGMTLAAPRAPRREPRSRVR